MDNEWFKSSLIQPHLGAAYP